MTVPSSPMTSRRVTRRDDWPITKSSTDNPTPTSTAYCSGISRVSTSVVSITVRGTGPVRAIATIFAGLTVPTPTTMSSPASAGIATCSTTPPRSTITSAITTAATRSANRLRAPAPTTSDVADIEPPTGVPRKTPDDDVADALADEVARRAGGAVGVGEAGRHPGSLDQADEGEGGRRKEQVDRRGQVGEQGEGQRARHVRDVRDHRDGEVADAVQRRCQE